MSTKDGMVEGDVTAEVLASFKEKFEAVKNFEEFEEVAHDYLENHAYKNYTDKTEDDIHAEIHAMVVEDEMYAAGDFADWAKSTAAKVNGVFCTESEDGTAVDAYILLTKPALAEYNSVNVRHILLTTETYETIEAAKAKGEEILAQWKAGEATAASFGALAAEFSEDGAPEGLYEDVLKGDMAAAFNDWIYADGRAVGDTGIVESDYGIHVMYMDGFGMPAWRVEAEMAMASASFSAARAEMAEKYTVTVDSAALAMLDV
jgi:parvulin-like peptidyl-prolyl isomerase